MLRWFTMVSEVESDLEEELGKGIETALARMPERRDSARARSEAAASVTLVASSLVVSVSLDSSPEEDARPSASAAPLGAAVTLSAILGSSWDADLLVWPAC